MLVIATGNPHKVREIRQGLHIEAVGLNHFGRQFAEPEETGETFEENARIKALSYALQTGHRCLADDSGLMVDALDGAPGVISSHWCTDGRDTGMTREERDLANNERLLREMRGVENRKARFVCVMVLADPEEGILTSSRGTFEGAIGLEDDVPRGENGFGYDPLFVIEDGRTSAELSPEEKHARSHRGEAIRRLRERLDALA